jgi:hypothetical protein
LLKDRDRAQVIIKEEQDAARLDMEKKVFCQPQMCASKPFGYKFSKKIYFVIRCGGSSL